MEYVTVAGVVNRKERRGQQISWVANQISARTSKFSLKQEYT